MKEVELREPLRAFLEPRGYRLFFDPDGTGYFDAIALKEDEVGLVELKIADWRRVFEQAVIRRGWGDWVAVLLPRRSLAEKLLRGPAPERTRRVGVWCLEAGQVQVLREPSLEGSAELREAFAGWRSHLREVLEARERGLLPEGVSWRILRPRRTGGPPGAPLDPRLWRLEEFDGESPSSGPSSALPPRRRRARPSPKH